MAFMDIKRLQKSISTFVGEILTTDKLPSDSNLKPGTMVTSIQKCPADARLMSLPVESLVALPPKLDPGESASSKFTKREKLAFTGMFLDIIP